MDGGDPGTLFEVGYATYAGLPVVALAQSTKCSDLTMLQGSPNCRVVDDFSTAPVSRGVGGAPSSNLRVLLFSGGIESTALAYWRRPDLLLTIDYGQRPAAGELRAASHLASQLDLPHEVVTADVGALGSGDMVGRGVASHSTVSEAWPFRNQFLVTVARHGMCGSQLEGNHRGDGHFGPRSSRRQS